MTERSDRYSTDVSFHCPVGTELVLRFEGVEARLKSTLIGMERGEFLIVRTPKVVGPEPLLSQGDPIKVIFIYDGTIYGFLSKYIHHVRVPSPMLFISCPESMERHEMRKDLRVDCFIPATIHIDDQIVCRGVVSDLSTGGCRITMNHEGGDQMAHLQPENQVVIAIEMLGIKPDRGILGSVKNLHHDAKKIHIGMKFSTSDPDVMSRIQEYIEHVLGIMR
jgi:c-di-GMP-binding flagellar brake protein YcgR